MYSLILTLVSITLFSSFLLVSVNYVNPVSIMTSKIGDRITDGLYDLKSGYSDYVTANGSEPNVISDITPSYAFIPNAIVKNGVWTLGAGTASGRYVCLSGDFNGVQLLAAKKSQAIHSPEAFFISTACGATVDAPPLMANTTESVSITFWLSSYI